jgi:hypothetical protein
MPPAFDISSTPILTCCAVNKVGDTTPPLIGSGKEQSPARKTFFDTPAHGHLDLVGSRSRTGRIEDRTDRVGNPNAVPQNDFGRLEGIRRRMERHSRRWLDTATIAPHQQMHGVRQHIREPVKLESTLM